MLRARKLALAGTVAVCAPPLLVACLLATFPLAASPGSRSALVASGSAPKAGFAPDPAPVAATRQWIFDIDVRAGNVTLKDVRAVDLKKAQATRRVFGRYALELWIGRELLDRVRFNVPGAGDSRPEDKSKRRRVEFDRVNTKFSVTMADQPRATYLKLVDRASGTEQRFSWPWTSGDAGGVVLPSDAGLDGAVDRGVDAGSAPDADVSDAGFSAARDARTDG